MLKKLIAKRANFVRLAEKRTKAVLKKVEVLGRCADKKLYQYSKADVKKIFERIHQEMDKVWQQFSRGGDEEFRW